MGSSRVERVKQYVNLYNASNLAAMLLDLEGARDRDRAATRKDRTALQARRAVVAPVQHATHGTVWSVELDGHTRPERYVYAGDAMDAAEARVGHAMAWERR